MEEFGQLTPLRIKIVLSGGRVLMSESFLERGKGEEGSHECRIVLKFVSKEV